MRRSKALPSSRRAGRTVRRTTSRNRRFRRFRRTIRCPYRGTTSPALGYGLGEVETKTSRWSVLLRSPHLNKARISRLRVIRHARGKRWSRPPPSDAEVTAISDPLLRGVRDRQALPSLTPTPVQDLTPRASTHASAEPVLVQTPASARPVCRFTHRAPPGSGVISCKAIKYTVTGWARSTIGREIPPAHNRGR